MVTLIGDNRQVAMDMAKLTELGVRNLHEVFGRGVRGETRARGFCSDEALVHVREAGITKVVDLRTADHNARLSARCAAVGLEYDHIPMDASSTSPDVLHAGLSRLFEIVDGGGFYISCQQGLRDGLVDGHVGGHAVRKHGQENQKSAVGGEGHPFPFQAMAEVRRIWIAMIRHGMKPLLAIWDWRNAVSSPRNAGRGRVAGILSMRRCSSGASRRAWPGHIWQVRGFHGGGRPPHCHRQTGSCR